MKLKTLLAAAPALVALGCNGGSAPDLSGASTFDVTIEKVNGKDPPTADKPLPANRGDHEELWQFTIQAHDATGQPTPFEGFVRLTTKPGTVLSVEGDGAIGRNALVKGGQASGVAHVTAVYGPTRLWVEDIGYKPAPPGKKPECSDGINNNPEVNTLIDYPADPGCAYADDDTEDGGTYAAAVSAPIQYALPKLSDAQGQAAQTPYPNEALTLNTFAPESLVVTRVSSDGFYVTDITEQSLGYNHIFAFNFSTPAGMRVCDRVTYLAGTVNEFFGFTELSFPSYQLTFPIEGKDPCLVPDPILLTTGGDNSCPTACPKDSACIGGKTPMCVKCPTACLTGQTCVSSNGQPACATNIADGVGMERAESALVRMRGFKLPTKFGSGVVVKNAPDATHSNCDLNGDGQVDFASDTEGGCAMACEADPECSEWTNFSARSEIKVHDPSGSFMQVDLSTASNFDPSANKGLVLDSVTGTMRQFSGGKLNWTVAVRCQDDLVCKGNGCSSAELSSQKACVRLRTEGDNDQGTN